MSFSNLLADTLLGGKFLCYSLHHGSRLGAYSNSLSFTGGDMMSLLIKKEIFEEPLARFYIAELTLALESVQSLGFIHR